VAGAARPRPCREPPRRRSFGLTRCSWHRSLLAGTGYGVIRLARPAPQVVAQGVGSLPPGLGAVAVSGPHRGGYPWGGP